MRAGTFCEGPRPWLTAVLGAGGRLTLGACLLGACTLAPADKEAPTLVLRPRVLAVEAEPPEARPGESVALTVTLVGPNGALEEGLEDVVFCTVPSPPGSRQLVSDACRGEAGVAWELEGRHAVGTIPRDACQRFGPDPAPSNSGGWSRPQDPDRSGGYFIPIRLRAFGQLWIHRLRVFCPLANAPVAAARRFGEAYETNVLPLVDKLEIRHRPSGSKRLQLQLAPESWESFPVWEPDEAALVTQSETLQATWYTNAGHFSESTVTRNADDGHVLETEWIPEEGTPHRSLWWWVVLRDSRGGVLTLGAPFDG